MSRNSAPLRPGTRALRLVAGLLLLGVAAAACSRKERPLRPRDLTSDETRYVDRVLVLERVRALLLIDGGRGISVGDSLAIAWGDSALPETLAMAPAAPERAARLHDLLLRLVVAEQDSLVARDGRRPLDAPWPTPADSINGALTPGASRGRRDD